jgi:lytic cellulose monooxygenase (C1-hydroxylating)
MLKTVGLLALAATAKLASAHATVYAAWINDVDQGLGNSASGYIRSPPNNSPLVDVTSKDMTCNVNNVATAKTLKVKAGDKVTFEWHHDSRSDADDIIASSHNGPVMTYIAPTAAGSAGTGWVKLAEDGFSGGKWAVERLIANRGKHSVTIPDIAAGQYLLRPEIIALHEGNRAQGAQFYMECVQIEITSSGSKTLPAGVAIPGTYSATDPGILFDIYNSFSSYPIPGPKVWDGSSSGGAAPAPSSSSTPATPTSSKPATSTTKPTTLTTVVRTSTAAPPPSTTTSPSSGSGSGSVPEWSQCGGINYTGATACASGLICKQWNPYYFQCIKA